MAQDIRWQQRLQNYDRAITLLGEPFERDILALSQLEQEGVAQRFEIAVELGWKTLKDYLEHEGQIIEPLTPRHVVKEAFRSHILRDGQVWLDMLLHRNLLSHTYDGVLLSQVVPVIRDRYLEALQELRTWFFAHREPE